MRVAKVDDGGPVEWLGNVDELKRVRLKAMQL
jgi:hypothetical protein